MQYIIKKLQVRRTFGVELEFNSPNRNELKRIIESTGELAEVAGYRHNNDNRRWCCKTDSSCGYEVASRVFSCPQDLRILRNVVEALHNDERVRADNRCGFHVHINVSDFNRANLGKLVAYWIKIEPFILDTVPARRKNNTYCAPLSKEIRNVEVGNLESLIRGERHRALNTTIFENRRRIEFRLAEGTKDPETVLNWVRFLLHFVNTVKTLDPPETFECFLGDELLELLGLKNKEKEDETFIVLSPALAKMRKWLIERAKINAELDMAKRFADRLLTELT